MLQCKKCRQEFAGEACWNCGAAVKADEGVFSQNARFLGFADAERLHEAPSWTKAGDVRRAAPPAP